MAYQLSFPFAFQVGAIDGSHIHHEASTGQLAVCHLKSVANNTIMADERSLPDPAPFIQVNNLGDFSVDFLVRVWVPSSEFFQYQADMKRKVKEALDEGGVEIPFPTRTVLQHSDG